MSVNYGKAFEKVFKEDFLNTVPESTIDRLYDPVGGFSGVTNISDFIGYSYPNIFYCECKSIQGNTFPFSNLKQYEKLISKVGIHGVRAGVIVWFRDHDAIIYAPINTVAIMIRDGKKSININKDMDKYRLINIPSNKKRVFVHGDYSVLKDLQEGD